MVSVLLVKKYMHTETAKKQGQYTQDHVLLMSSADSRHYPPSVPGNLKYWSIDRLIINLLAWQEYCRCRSLYEYCVKREHLQHCMGTQQLPVMRSKTAFIHHTGERHGRTCTKGGLNTGSACNQTHWRHLSVQNQKGCGRLRQVYIQGSGCVVLALTL